MKKIKIVALVLFSMYLVQTLNVQMKANSATVTVSYVHDVEEDTSVAYQLDVYVSKGGKVRNQSSGEEISNTREGILIGEEETITFEILPDEDAQIQQVLLNGEDITSTITSNQVTITGSDGNQTLEVSFEIVVSTNSSSTPNTGVEVNITIYQILIILSLFILVILQRRKERMKVYDGLNIKE